ncbi:MAG TPA: shikimate dehydrogenase [Longimicrobiales bacterium]|nr:shikimate dehydrogenase [Longimicrobiales bacterium]
MSAAGTAPTAHTRVFAVLGDPVAHSLSPAIHNAAFAAAAVDATFVALHTGADAVAQLMHALARAGGGGSVTVPHKQRAAGALARAGEAVVRTGACNTFWGEQGRLCGDNTDVIGFRQAAAHHGVMLDGARVLLLGAGGAAAAVLAVLQDARARVTIASRSASRAQQLVAMLHSDARVSDGEQPGSYDIIVNATPLGLAASDPLPLPLDGVSPAATLLDLVYAPGMTAWVRAGRERGLQAYDGAEMLLRQAAAAFERWTGSTAPLPAMRRALESAAQL